MPDLTQLRDELALLEDDVVTLGRYRLLEALAATSYSEKLAHAEAASRLLDAAYTLQQFSWRQYHAMRRRVAWSAAANPELLGLIEGGSVDRDAVMAKVASVEAMALARGEALLQSCRSDLALAPVERVVPDLLRLLQSVCGRHDAAPASVSAGTGVYRPRAEVRRTVVGPRRTSVDPMFQPTYSSLAYAAPKYGDRLHEALPYYWTLATREAMASDSCALSATEYDGLPLDFYRDMGKQCWDEARHAVLFCEFCRAMAPVLQAELPQDSALAITLERFVRTGTGLPIPREGNFYEVLWLADLVERLILMQVETEAPAVRTLARRAGDRLCSRFPAFRQLVQIDRNDEISHARIGHRWLRFLVPDATDRKQRRENTALLRGVLFASVLAQNEGVELSDVIATFGSAVGRARMPKSLDPVLA